MFNTLDSAFNDETYNVPDKGPLPLCPKLYRTNREHSDEEIDWVIILVFLLDLA
jgi:hypothetical protein